MDYEMIGKDKVTPLMICVSGAGYYIGRLTEHRAPFSRVSNEYYRTLEEAKKAHVNVEWTPREDSHSIKICLEYNLIKKFRDEVNKHEFYSGILKNVEGKNKWNLICSCMDWISVAAGGLPQLNIFGSDRFTTSLNLMQYIASVDILSEAIIQLYRVIEENKNYPLKDDRSIFKQEVITDDIYFKHVRAVFGIHPVNLNSINGIAGKSNNRYFAGWTNPSFNSDRSFSVALYSNNPDEKDYILELDLWLISKYAMKRYNLLVDLISKVKDTTTRHIENYSKMPISITGVPVAQLKILKLENSKRFGKYDGYSWEIDMIERLIEIYDKGIGQIDKQIAYNYKEYLISLISEIKTKLEKLEYNDKSLGDYYVYIPHPENTFNKSEIVRGMDDEKLKEHVLQCDDENEIKFIRYAMIYHVV